LSSNSWKKGDGAVLEEHNGWNRAWKHNGFQADFPSNPSTQMVVTFLDTEKILAMAVGCASHLWFITHMTYMHYIYPLVI